MRAARRAVAERQVGQVGRGGQRLERRPIGAARARERHRLGGAAVEPVAEAEDGGPAGRGAGELDRRFHGLGAGVGQDGLPWPARQEAGETLVSRSPGSW